MRIIFERADKSVGVIIPSPEWTGTMEELAAKCVPLNHRLNFVKGHPRPEQVFESDGSQKPCLYKIVEDNEVPTDRTFRNAWKCDIQNKQGISHDIDKCKAIWKDKLSAAASEAGIEVDAKTLEAVDAAETHADIKAIWPEGLSEQI